MTLRRLTLLALAPLAALAGVACEDAAPGGSAGGSRSPGGPNVLLVVVDDVGVEHLDWHPVGRASGNTAPTPFLSRMAQEGVVFTEAYGAPLCSPCRAALLTGRYSFRHGVGSNVEWGDSGLPDSEVTLAEQLLRAGYATGAFGKWHLSTGFDDPLKQGFQHSDCTLRNLADGYYLWLRLVNGVMTWESGYNTTVITDAAMEWIEARNAEHSPWFAYVAYNAAHLPVDPPPPELCPTLPVREGDSTLRLYHATLEALDHELARLVPLAGRDALVLVVGDNGSQRQASQPPVPAGLGRHKFSVYQGGIRVPVLAWGATVERRGEEHGRLHAVDLYRTILDAAGAPCDEVPIDSRSLLDPCLPSEQRWVPGREWLLTEWFLPNGAPPNGPHTTLRRALLGPRYKYVVLEGQEQLYDLLADPWEARDLLEDGTTEDESAILARMRAELTSVLES